MAAGEHFLDIVRPSQKVVTTLLTTGGRGGSDIRYNLQIGSGAGVWRPLVEVRDKTRT